MTRYEIAVSAYQDRIGPAVLADRRSDVGDLLAAVGPRVVDLRNQSIDGPTLDLNIELHRALSHTGAVSFSRGA